MKAKTYKATHLSSRGKKKVLHSMGFAFFCILNNVTMRIMVLPFSLYTEMMLEFYQ